MSLRFSKQDLSMLNCRTVRLPNASGARTPRRPEVCHITLISPHALVGRGEYRKHGATAGRAGKCEIHRTTDTPQARETT
jgi:hypothetical protein